MIVYGGWDVHINILFTFTKITLFYDGVNTNIKNTFGKSFFVFFYIKLPMHISFIHYLDILLIRSLKVK